jgi:hypothetical protein
VSCGLENVHDIRFVEEDIVLENCCGESGSAGRLYVFDDTFVFYRFFTIFCKI